MPAKGLQLKVEKRSYKAPRLVRAGSFEELTRAVCDWDQIIVFGMTGRVERVAGMS